MFFEIFGFIIPLIVILVIGVMDFRGFRRR